MQYNAPNLMSVFQNFSGSGTLDPFNDGIKNHKSLGSLLQIPVCMLKDSIKIGHVKCE